MMSTPEYKAGWDSIYRLHWDAQAADEVCNVLMQAIANQGGVYETWQALDHQAKDDNPLTSTFEYFAGGVMACHSIFEQ